MDVGNARQTARVPDILYQSGRGLTEAIFRLRWELPEDCLRIRAVASAASLWRRRWASLRGCSRHQL